MVDLSTLALFSVAALALTMSPGPDMLLIASRSASQGKVSGFATLPAFRPVLIAMRWQQLSACRNCS